jgi:hypothetical protein
MLLVKELEKIYKQKKQKTEKTVSKKGIVKEKLIEGFETITLQEFKGWYAKSNYNLGCHYCQTTAEQTLRFYNEAIEGKRHNWTRGGKRGKRLELDRKDPSKKYDELSNLVWCCYWCNNAKTNFFTESEFLPIAQAIGNALKSTK